MAFGATVRLEVLHDTARTVSSQYPELWVRIERHDQKDGPPLFYLRFEESPVYVPLALYRKGERIE